MTEQAQQLAEKPHVVIATPGRLADHIESGTNFSLSKIQMLVRGRFLNYVQLKMKCVVSLLIDN